MPRIGNLPLHLPNLLGAQKSNLPTRQQTLTFDLPGIGRKTYTFPSQFHKVDVATAEFLLDSKTVARWLPPGFKPAPVLGAKVLGETRAMVTVQHLGQPAGMDPYTEASFSVRVVGPDGKQAWHCLLMPVTSEENLQRGKVIFGYPKEMAQVSLSDAGKMRKGSVATADGQPLFRLGVSTRDPITLNKTIDNQNLQRLDGKTVSLSSEAKGALRPSLRNSLEFGRAMTDRFPGLPRKPLVLLGATMTDADLSLALPQ